MHTRTDCVERRLHLRWTYVSFRYRLLGHDHIPPVYPAILGRGALYNGIQGIGSDTASDEWTQILLHHKTRDTHAALFGQVRVVPLRNVRVGPRINEHGNGTMCGRPQPGPDDPWAGPATGG